MPTRQPPVAYRTHSFQNPRLEQAVVRSVEGGARSQGISSSAVAITWSVTGYRTGIRDDIMLRCVVGVDRDRVF